nr:DUF2946 domain-containing protein [Rhodoferax sp.]
MSPKPYFASLRRPPALWLAVLIALFGALAPTLSHAFVWSQGGTGPTVEVCTSTGMRWVASPLSADSPDGQESAPALEHCPFCLPSTDRAVPASRSLAFLVVVLGDPGEPTIWQAFFFSTHFALTPPPRGPPTFS